MWQFTGDYLILPGSNRDMDVNIFYGTPEELAEYFGNSGSATPDPIVIPPSETEPEPEPIFQETDLYTFSVSAYWLRPMGGPLVTPHYDIAKASGNKDVPLDAPYINWIQKMNSAIQWAKIIAKDWGPSKGFNENGILKLNGLVYPGRNVVRVTKIVKGSDGEKWGLLESINKNGKIPDSSVNYIDTPQLIHTVYGSTSKWSYSELANAPRVPVIGVGERWIQMKWLQPILLPKTVTITSGSGVNVRQVPGDLTNRSGVKRWMDKVSILELKIAKGGIWGRIAEGWIALRNNNTNLTDWKI